MIVSMETGNGRRVPMCVVALSRMSMLVASGSTIAVAMVIIVIFVIMALCLVIMMVVATAAGMAFVFLGRGRATLRKRNDLVTQSRHALGNCRRESVIALMFDCHRACRDRYGNVFNALQATNGRVDLRSAGSAVHAIDAIAALLCCRSHIRVPDWVVEPLLHPLVTRGTRAFLWNFRGGRLLSAAIYRRGVRLCSPSAAAATDPRACSSWTRSATRRVCRGEVFEFIRRLSHRALCGQGRPMEREWLLVQGAGGDPGTGGRRALPESYGFNRTLPALPGVSEDFTAWAISVIS